MILRSASLALAVALAVGVSGCASTPVAERTGTGEVRTDLDPLTSRFDLLAPAESAEWLSGTMGSGAAPGPSTYWIDAVVSLSEASAAELHNTYDLAETSMQPELERPLVMPEGPYLASAELDAAFSPDTYSTTVYLAGDSRTLIIRSVFE